MPNLCSCSLHRQSRQKQNNMLQRNVPFMTKSGTQLNKSDVGITLWTPRFILFFVIITISGLSAASILTEAQMNNHYQSSLILSGYVVVILIALIVLTCYTRSSWMRVSTLFGYLWAIFSLITFFLPASGPLSLIRVQLLAAASSTLLGFYVCLSTHQTPHRHWDTLLFGLGPLLGACIVVGYILLHPINNGHLRGLVETATTVLLAFGSMLWWLRPSCWRTQACPTFLFGIAPLIFIFVTYWAGDTLGTRPFLSQLALLCILLGIIRVIQAERQTRLIQFKTQVAQTVSMSTTRVSVSNTPHDEQNEDRPDSVIEKVQQHARPE